MGSLSLSIIEIIVLMLGAVTLGITIHFFISSRRSFKAVTSGESDKVNRELESWKLRYFNDIEFKDKELEKLRTRLTDIEENDNINSIEAEELRKENKQLKRELEEVKNSATVLSQEQLPASHTDKPDYLEQLRLAQSSLLDHNDKINKLLSQIDVIKEAEQKQQEILRYNDELNQKIDDLKSKLSHKEKEIHNIEEKAHLTKEMTSMLDNAYNEFGVLQDKIQKLENQVAASKKISLEYEDLKEGYAKITEEFDEQKVKYNAMINENKELHQQLGETQDKLRTEQHKNQQLQKQVAYLEELNNDMQAVADTNKKLESQIKRLGELESMLNVVSQEKEELEKKQFKGD
ncbi:MAG TPA: hypothetical protein PLU37_00525 [Chitinophagaceae bacterium]|nr:hypothetical protein [Chitinophagaceae bacterium]MCB9054782.1 hypothetical protein [Chitinophagales bacterium]HPG09983.1 hypothetical protein [Chitinophagaceae bacterium]